MFDINEIAALIDKSKEEFAETKLKTIKLHNLKIKIWIYQD